MTGFGRAERISENRRICVEMKSVNNRYLDINIRMPKKLNSFEAKIRNILSETIIRGKVDVFITVEEYGSGVGTLKYNHDLAGQYAAYMKQMAEAYGLGNVTVSDVASAPEVFMMMENETNECELWKDLEPVLREAVSAYNDARQAEGARLYGDLQQKLKELEAFALEVEAHEPEILEAYRLRLLDKLAEILEDNTLEESRLAAECVLFADKISTDEETVRLKSHIKAMSDTLNQTGSIGRKLDFLAQEMNREANTTLSKAGDLMTADIGINMKTVIEKVREQIQNVE